MTAQPASDTEANATMHEWRREIVDRVAKGARFGGLHATATAAGARLTTVLVDAGGFELVDVEVAGDASYPALTTVVPAAAWYEREIADTFGLIPLDHPRLQPLVLPLGSSRDDAQAGRPVRPRPGSGSTLPRLTPDEAAIPAIVLGDGMFTIPHGPVRSGVFESVEYLVETPGEDIPYVGIRVFAKHRGIERRFEDVGTGDGVLLAERVEGIASVAHALAYCHAIEAITATQVPRRAAMTRVVYAELERIANHLDVAMKLCDAAGLAVGTARFGLHKEHLLRLIGQLCNSRFGRGAILPGGVRSLPAIAPAQLRLRLAELEAAIRSDAAPLMRTPSFLDRLRRTGPLAPALARAHGALGPIGRASGFDDDNRRLRPYDGYRFLDVPVPQFNADGDALARLRVRFEEVWGSFALIGHAIEATDASADQLLLAPIGNTSGEVGRGVGWAEAPQGEVVYVVEIEDDRIVRCKPRSASFHNLVLFHDVFSGDILTDFPFTEASFGLSIAGVAS
jgi:formate hydrogenlyase subunit 5